MPSWRGLKRINTLRRRSKKDHSSKSAIEADSSAEAGLQPRSDPSTSQSSNKVPESQEIVKGSSLDTYGDPRETPFSKSPNENEALPRPQSAQVVKSPHSHGCAEPRTEDLCQPVRPSASPSDCKDDDCANDKTTNTASPQHPIKIQQIWNEAYDKLKDEMATRDLMDTYERILSNGELQKMMLVGETGGKEASDTYIGRRNVVSSMYLGLH